MKIHFKLIALFIIIVQSEVVLAENILVKNIMAGCVPDSSSLAKKSCRTGGHGVFYQGNGGSCRLICPIPVNFPKEKMNDLSVQGRDPDGKGGKYKIQANFKKSKVGSTSAATICSVDTNKPATQLNVSEVTTYASYPCLGPNYKPFGFPFPAFKPNPKTWYWLEVIISRSSGANEEVEALGFTLK